MIVDVLIADKSDPTEFYLKYDFVRFPDQPRKLYVTMTTIEKTLERCGII